MDDVEVAELPTPAPDLEDAPEPPAPAPTSPSETLDLTFGAADARIKALQPPARKHSCAVKHDLRMLLCSDLDQEHTILPARIRYQVSYNPSLAGDCGCGTEQDEGCRHVQPHGGREHESHSRP